MEVTQDAYKDTKVGRIPKDWEVVNLDYVLEEFQNGYAFSSKGYLDRGTPIVSMAYIGLKGQFNFDYQKAKYWNSEEKNKLANYVLRKGDLLIAMTDVTPAKNLIGRMIIIDIDDEFFLNQRVGLLRCNSKIDPKFLMYFGNGRYWRHYSMSYSTLGVQTNLGTKEIKKGKIPLPSKPEQQKIAEILSTVDEQIATTGKIIEKSKELKKGLMQKLFSQGIGHTEFKDTKIGRIPKDWKVIFLKDCCEINKDSLPSSTKGDYSFYYLDLSLVKKGVIDFPMTKVEFKNAPSRAKRKINKGDVLMSTVRPNLLGNAYVTFDSEEYIVSTGFAVLSCLKDISSEFLYHYLYCRMMQYQIETALIGSSYPAINSKDISILKVPLPPIAEQQKIAAILSETDAKIRKEQTQKLQLEALKKGLMQQLLTGKKRVVV